MYTQAGCGPAVGIVVFRVPGETYRVGCFYQYRSGNARNVAQSTAVALACLRVTVVFSRNARNATQSSLALP